jgi:hypothetical protein
MPIELVKLKSELCASLTLLKYLAFSRREASVLPASLKDFLNQNGLVQQ